MRLLLTSAGISTSLANLRKLAGTIAVPSYLIDDSTAIKVVNSNIEVISEGYWELYTPGSSMSGNIRS